MEHLDYRGFSVAVTEQNSEGGIRLDLMKTDKARTFQIGERMTCAEDG